MARKIEIPIRTTGASKAKSDLKKVDKSVDGLTASVKALAVGFIGVQSLKFFATIAKRAGRIDTATRALDNLTGSVERSASFLEAMTVAVAGTVSNFDLMTTASKFLVLGFAETEEQMAKLTQGAIILGATVGKDALESLETFTQLMTNKSIVVMDNLGISVSIYVARVKELSKETNNLTVDQEKNLAIMEQLEAAVKKQSNLLDGAGGGVQRLGASVQNLSDAFTKEFIKSISDGADALTSLVKGLQGSTKFVIALGKSILELALFIPIFRGLFLAVNGLSLAFRLLRFNLRSIIRWFKVGVTNLKFWTASIKDVVKGTIPFKEMLGIIISDIVVWIGKAPQAVKLLGAFGFVAARTASRLKEVNKEIKKLSLNLDDIKQADVDAIKTQMLILKRAQQDLLGTIGTEIEQGKFEGAISGINSELGRFRKFQIEYAAGPRFVTQQDIIMSEDYIAITQKLLELQLLYGEAIKNLPPLPVPDPEELTEGMKIAFRSLEDFASNVGNAWSDALVQGQNSMKAFHTAWHASLKKMLATIIANAAILGLVGLFTGGASLGGILGKSGGLLGALFGGVKFAAQGMNETVTKPTFIIAGEKGPEHVNITPLRGRPQKNTSTVNIYISGGLVDENFVRNELNPILERVQSTG